MARIVKRGFNIAGMELAAIIKHYCVLLRRPFVNIGGGPKLKEMIELFGLHYIGPRLVTLEIRHPRIYRLYIRLRDSVVFRYQRYRNLLLRRLGNRQR